MIVETETVQTPAQNLLPVQPEEKNDEEAMSLATQEEATANLIDHNPLSIHNSNVAIRNKKSSLLIDSFLGKEGSAAAPAPAVGVNAGSASGAKSGDDTQRRDDKVDESKHDGTASSVAGPASVSGGADDDHHDVEGARKPPLPSKKADFFAARLASAVGENEISDSEETFVYESTANSTTNATPSVPGVPGLAIAEQKSYGIPAKMSAPLLNNNANSKLLNRAKTTRHTSIAVIPQQSEPVEDSNSIRSLNRQNAQEIQSVRSYATLSKSPGKRLSLVSLAQKGPPPRRTSRKVSVNSTARRKKSQKRQLRTTASKIFDAHGASLRRYSGVPDDVNLEDYVEQAGGELTPNKFTYHSDSEFEDDPGSFVHHPEDEEDNHSMFYYSQPKNDLEEARPPLSDYEEEEDEQEDAHAYAPNIGFYSDDYFYHPTEATPLKRKNSARYPGYSPHDFYTTKTTWTRLKNFVYFAFVVSFLLTLGFISGFLLATNKELHDLEISRLASVLTSTDELVFDIIATAFNPGFFSIQIKDVELDIFAKTSHLNSDGDKKGTPYETILLGTVKNLETSLQFQGGFFHRNYDISRSSVKLVHPGLVEEDPNREELRDSDEDDGVSKWKQLIRYEFELIVRGNMYYKVPFFNSQKSIGVQSNVQVDPNRAHKSATYDEV